MVTASSAGPRETLGQNASGADEEQTKRTQSEDILNDIKKLEDSYGQKTGRVAKPIPFSEAEKLFRKVEELTRASA